MKFIVSLRALTAVLLLCIGLEKASAHMDPLSRNVQKGSRGSILTDGGAPTCAVPCMVVDPAAKPSQA